MLVLNRLNLCHSREGETQQGLHMHEARHLETFDVGTTCRRITFPPKLYEASAERGTTSVAKLPWIVSQQPRHPARLMQPLPGYQLTGKRLWVFVSGDIQPRQRWHVSEHSSD
jgi:hypothetical protein